MMPSPRGPALGLALILALLPMGSRAEEPSVEELMQEALDAEKARLEASPDDPAINARLGMAYIQLGDPDQGLELLDRAVELAPDEPRYLYQLGRGLYGAKSYDQVLETVARVLDHPACDDRLAAEALVLSGTVHLRRNERGAADADFLRALARDETYAPAHMNMGIRLMQNGDHAGAEKELVRAAELAPSDPKALSTLAQLYERTGRQTTAFLYWQRVAVLVPDDYRVQMMVAGHYIARGEDRTARPYLERAIELQPAMAEPHLEMAELLTRQKDYERAWEEAQKAKRLGLENELLTRRLEIIRSGEPDPYLEMERIPADQVSSPPREGDSEEKE
jgi:tetratricopeptide (TPR) repeat protein